MMSAIQVKKMRFTQKIQIGFKMAKNSLRMVSDVNGIFYFPFMSLLVTGLIVSLILAIGYHVMGGYDGLVALILPTDLDGSLLQQISKMQYCIMMGLFLIGSFLIQATNLFLSVAMLSTIKQALLGQQASLKAGFRHANQKLGLILRYAGLISAVSLLMTILSYILERFSRFKIVGAVLAYIASLTISLATYFMAPVIAFGNKHAVKDNIQQSAKIMKEQFASNISAKIFLGAIWWLGTLILSLAVVLVMLLCDFNFSNLVQNHSWEYVIGLQLGIGFVALAIVNTLWTIFWSVFDTILKVILYTYATEQKLPENIDAGILPYLQPQP